jgi:hypothetical protein
MAAVITGIVTQSLTVASDTQKHPLNTLVYGDDGSLYQYVQATSTISQYMCVAIYGDGTMRPLDTSIAGAAGVLQARTVGFAQTSIASSYYGWVARQGAKIIFQVADDCAAGARLFTTATAGVVDDATVSEGLVVGLQLTTTSSLATAMTGVAATPAFIGMYTNPA